LYSQISSSLIAELGDGPMVYLGLNVYRWDWADQNVFLVECLGPLAGELRARSAAIRLWFDRVDARGPHVMVLLTLPSGLAEFAIDLAARRLDEFSRLHQRRGTVSAEEAERLHLSLRGLTLCPLDREPGLAEENSYQFFVQPHREYPFHLTARWPPEIRNKAWTLVDDLFTWTIGRIAAHNGRRPTREAVLFLAALEREVRGSFDEPEAFWRHYSGTLLFGLPGRLQDDPEEFFRALPRVIGSRNQDLFARLWRELEVEGPPWHGLAELVRLVSEPEVGAGSAMDFLRELAHWTLKQLCVSVSSEIPLVLYSWTRNLASLPDGGDNPGKKSA
jgi:hypothetical protein